MHCPSQIAKLPEFIFADRLTPGLVASILIVTFLVVVVYF
jgi:hypothetical protein